MSWLDDDSIYGMFNKPYPLNPGTHYDEDKPHNSNKPIPASGGPVKEDLLTADYLPSAAEVKKESEELFAEVGNQGGHAGNTAADSGSDDDEDAAARPQGGRGGKRGGAGRKADSAEVKAAKAAARAEITAQAKVIEAAKIAAIKANLSAAVEEKTASEGGGAPHVPAAAIGGGGGGGGGASVGGGGSSVGGGLGKARVGPLTARRAGSRRNSVEDTEALAADVAAAAPAATETLSDKVRALFKEFGVSEDTSRTMMDVELAKKANTIEKLKPWATKLGIVFPAAITKRDLTNKILDRMYG